MEKVGEVIEAATDKFVAQSYEVNAAPAFGSLVRAQQGAEGEATTVYGVVTYVETLALDPARRPVARGQEASSLTDIYDQHPQLRELFRTQFTATVVGHGRDGIVHQYLPPLPPEIHQLVYLCGPQELVTFSQDLTFLSLLLASQGSLGSEEVAAAFLRRAAQARGEAGHQFLVRAGKQLVSFLRGEPVRLTSLLARLR